MIDVMRSIPVTVRQTIYGLYALIIFVIGGIQVWYATSGDVSPDWIESALAVGAYAGIGLGVTAAANAPSNDDPPDPEGGYGLIELIVAVILILILVAFLFSWAPWNNGK